MGCMNIDKEYGVIREKFKKECGEHYWASNRKYIEDTVQSLLNKQKKLYKYTELDLGNAHRDGYAKCLRVHKDEIKKLEKEENNV